MRWGQRPLRPGASSQVPQGHSRGAEGALNQEPLELWPTGGQMRGPQPGGADGVCAPAPLILLLFGGPPSLRCWLTRFFVAGRAWLLSAAFLPGGRGWLDLELRCHRLLCGQVGRRWGVLWRPSAPELPQRVVPVEDSLNVFNPSKQSCAGDLILSVTESGGGAFGEVLRNDYCH